MIIMMIIVDYNNEEDLESIITHVHMTMISMIITINTTS